MKCFVILKRHTAAHDFKWETTTYKTKHVFSMTKGDMILMGLNFMDYILS